METKKIKESEGSMFSSLTKKISIIVLGILTVTLTSMIIVLQVIEQNRSQEEAEKHGHNLSELIMSNIVYSMGEGLDDVSPIVDNASQLENIRDIRVIPTDLIYNNSEDRMDEREKSVVNTLQSLHDFEEFMFCQRLVDRCFNTVNFSLVGIIRKILTESWMYAVQRSEQKINIFNNLFRTEKCRAIILTEDN